MPTKTLLDRALRALFVTTLAAAPIGVAGAQYNVGGMATVSGGENGCQNVGTTSVATSCATGAASASLTLDAFNSPLFHAGASTTVADERATAEMYLTDSFTFLGVVPSELRFDVYLHGVAQGTNSWGMFNFYDHTFSEPSAAIGLQPGVDTDHTTGTFTMFLDEGSNVATFGFGLLAQAWNISALGGVGGASADFSHTAYVSLVRAYDANGNQITDGLTVQTASGYTYRFDGMAPTTATPEPASLALFGTGALLLGGVVRRRRATR